MIESYQWKFGLKIHYLRWMNIFRAPNYVVAGQNKTKQLIVPKRMNAYIVVISY